MPELLMTAESRDDNARLLNSLSDAEAGPSIVAALRRHGDDGLAERLLARAAASGRRLDGGIASLGAAFGQPSPRQRPRPSGRERGSLSVTSRVVRGPDQRIAPLRAFRDLADVSDRQLISTLADALLDDGAVGANLLITAASAGLFPVATFSSSSDDARWQLDQRDYRVRRARRSDLPELERLEVACWGEAMAASSDRLQRRIDRFPSGQFVLELESRVAAVLYSQRIESGAVLETSNDRSVEDHHVPEGRTIQLLAANVATEFQNRSFGFELLEHVLQVYSSQGDVDEIAGVTRCRDFVRHPGMPIAEYLTLRTETGVLSDPVLRFHELHGAEIAGPLCGYRPGDADNHGDGVLVRYVLEARFERMRAAMLKHADVEQPASRTRRERPSSSAADSAITSAVVDSVAELLNVAAGEVTTDVPLLELGLDSLDLTQLRATLSQATGAVLSTSFFFDHPTVAAVARALAGRSTAAVAHASDLRRPSSREPIAIVGMACRFPGAPSLHDFWQLLLDGRDAVATSDAPRWRDALDAATYPQVDSTLRQRVAELNVGLIDDVDLFDAAFFRITPREAEAMDPQQRILLEVAWHALEHAGISGEALKESHTGVFVGAFSNDYERLRARAGRSFDGWSSTGGSSAVLAGRLAYVLGLNGPAMSVDTACSSSLVAVHLACQSLRSGECHLALSGGVNLLLSPEPSFEFAQAGMLSPTGRCRTFDASADGYVRGEGCGVVVLKRLSDARRDGDDVLAIIRGTAVNHDGASNGLTAPSGRAQQQLIRAALANAELAPTDVTFLEAHGTGTPLGDPVELQSAAAVLGTDRDDASPLLVGSVKSNIGHLEAAAGIAGLIKATLALQHGMLPATLHFQRPNPEIPWQRLAVQVAVEPQSLVARSQLAAAGVSSFGYSGTNAHVVLQAADVLVGDDAATGSRNARLGGRPLYAFQRQRYWFEAASRASVATAAYRVEWKPAAVFRAGAAGPPPGASLAQANREACQGALQVLARLGIEPCDDDSTLEATFDRCGIAVSHRQLWRRLHRLALLHDHSAPTVCVPAATLDIVRRCGSAMPDVLRGAPALDLLFPADGEVGAAEIYRETAASHVLASKLRDVVGRRTSDTELSGVAKFAQSFGELRLLEIGAGTGATTESLLKALADQKFEYTFTDVSPAFATYAEKLAAELGNLNFATLDIEHEPVAQGFAEHSCDVIVAANVLHATRDIRSTLAHVRSLLKDDGTLLLIEHTVPHPWLDFTFGMLDGWWRFEDDVRSDSALVPIDRWPSLLTEAGFSTVDVTDPVGDGQVAIAAVAAAPAATPRDEERSQWRVIGGPAADQLAGILRARGQQAESIHDVKAFEFSGEQSSDTSSAGRTSGPSPLYNGLEVRPEGRAALLSRPMNVVDVRPLEAVSAPDDLEASEKLLLQSLELQQRVLRSNARLHLVTRNAQRVEVDDDVHPGQSALWGLARVMAVERPEAFGAISDLSTTDDLEVLATSLLLNDGEEQFAIRDGVCHVARLVPDESGSQVRITEFDPEASCLIVGGLGTLGREVASWLVDHGARHLVLTSRTPLGDEPSSGSSSAESTLTREEYVRRLRQRGVTVEPVVADVSVRSDVESLFCQLAGWPRLAGVIHVAGELQTCPLAGLSSDQLREQLAPKLHGAWYLHEATRDRDLDLFVCFSSAASVWGAAGQAGYAAANAALDGLCQHRRKLGLAGTSLNWGLWSAGGTADQQRDHIEASGLLPMPTADALRFLQAAVAGTAAQQTVTRTDWGTFLPQFNARRTHHLLDELVVASSDGSADAGRGSEQNRAAASASPFDESGRGGMDAVAARESVVRFSIGELRAFVRDCVAKVTRLDPDAIPDDAGLFSLGMDSMMAVEVRRRLVQRFQVALPATLVIDAPNVNAIVDRVQREIAAVGGTTQETDTPRADDLANPGVSQRLSRAPATTDSENVEPADRRQPFGREPIAIIGLGCRLPGARSPDELWQLLAERRSTVSAMPEGRWPSLTAGEGRHLEQAGWLDDLAGFDSDFFRVSPREARTIDPQHRLLLEVAWESLEDAGIRADELRGSRTGVFVGITSTEYRSLVAEADGGVSQLVTGGPLNAAAGRVSFSLGLRGPSQSIDTACSSSLVAIHNAVLSLQAGDCSLALAGGVNALISRETSAALDAAGILSRRGTCHAFDASADGIARAEGCGIVVLKRLADALRDGDRVDAIIRGCGVNQDGASAGLTVPNGDAQRELLERVLDVSGLAPRDVAYVEAHGTGTPLGDPVEARSLAAVYGAQRGPGSRLLIGSLKTNLGHLESAAGVAGLLKVVLAMRHGTIPAQLHGEVLNPEIIAESLPLTVVREATPWPQSRRIAGVSSFGATGTNAHLLVEAPAVAEQGGGAGPRGAASMPVRLVLSAKSARALRQLAERYVEWLMSHPDADLAAFCSTVNSGRCRFEVGCELQSANREDLLKQLRQLANETEVTGFETAAATASSNDRLGDDPAGQRSAPMSLPTYPFQRERYWVTSMPPRQSEHASSAPLSRPALDVSETEESRVLPEVSDRPRVTLSLLGQADETTNGWSGRELSATESRGELRIDSVESKRSADDRTVDSDASVRDVDSGNENASGNAAETGGMIEVIRQLIADTLYLDIGRVQDDRPFIDLGLDSILGVEFIKAVNQRFGLRLKATVVYDHSTVSAFSQFLTEQGGGSRERCLPKAFSADAAVPSDAGPPSFVPPADQAEDRRGQREGRGEQAVPPLIAVIGMSCRFPGAPNVDSFWENLRNGVDSICEVPADRWAGTDWFHPDPKHPGTASSRSAGLLDDVDLFDAAFFGIAPSEAARMDPQQRIFLEECWLAIEASGIDPRSLSGAKCGVFAGAGASDYLDATGAARERHRLQLTGSLASMLPARIAYLLDLRGPVLAIDTACSSSLVAIHEACESLRHGGCDLALAGGVSLMHTPASQILTSQFAITSPSGRCASFSDDADGVAWSEGCGVVVLKRLDDALADGDPIHAVIRGSGVNYDGATNGMTAPSADSQTDLLRDIYDRFGIDPRSITAIEAHGTGTLLGDPIEFDALRRVFADLSSDRPSVALGSVKTNIGHAAMAAGVAGFIKSVLSLQHHELPPMLHFRAANPHVDPGGSPFFVNTTLTSWDADERRTGVSSFGMSGTNAHVVLEEAPEHAGNRRSARPRTQFQRKRYWLEPAAPAPAPAPAPARAAELAEPRVRAEWSLRLSRDDAPWLADHCIGGEVVVPAAVLIAHALQRVPSGQVVTEFSVVRPLRVLERGDVAVRCLRDGGTDAGRFVIRSAEGDVHARFSVAPIGDVQQPVPQFLDDNLPLLDSVRLAGLGPCFDALTNVRGDDSQVVSDAVVPQSLFNVVGPLASSITLLDVAAQTCGLYLRREEPSGGLFLPFRYGRVFVADSLPMEFRCVARCVKASDAEQVVADVDFFDRDGQWLGEIQQLTCRRSPVTDGQTDTKARSDSQLQRTAHERPTARLEPLIRSDELNAAAAQVARPADPALVAWLRVQVQTLLELEEPPSSDAGFFDMGMDSLTAIDLDDLIRERFGAELSWPATLVFDFPTVRALAAELLRLGIASAADRSTGLPPVADVAVRNANPVEAVSKVSDDRSTAPIGSRVVPGSRLALRPDIGLTDSRGGDPTCREDDSGTSAEEPSGDRHGIAVVGMACRFPGADSLGEFWELLASGRDAIAEIPAGRWPEAVWDSTGDPDHALPPRHVGFLEGLDLFDAGFFRITPREALSLDPQQRLLLEVSWSALEHAGLAPSTLRGSRTGVFVGISTSDYERLVAQQGRHAVDGFFGTGSTHSATAGRLSHFLGLQGPAMAIDTACSSSLVAVHQACQSLRNGECDLAIVGGVNALILPELTIQASRAGMLSADGRCRTFDESASGYGRGEGCGVVILKRQNDARRDRDRILATVLGSAVNQDGASSGLTVPHGPSQQAVITAALRQAAVEPRDVSYLECHGTGTSLGDPIEVNAAAAALRPRSASEAPALELGSVKTNIGHLEAASGIAGLLKTVLALQHGLIPPHLHVDAPNPRIDWAHLPLRVASSATVWNSPGRIAGVSSFGFTGTNSHVVVGEARREVPGTVSSTGLPDLLVLSARSEGALRELAIRHRDSLTSGTAALSHICFTAAVGRDHFPHRLAVLARTGPQMADLLDAFLEGRAAASVWAGTAPVDGEASLRHAAMEIEATAHERSIDRCSAFAELFVAGQTLDFTRLYDCAEHQRVTIPGYPFQRTRFWITDLPAPVGTEHSSVVESPLLRALDTVSELNTNVGTDDLVRPPRQLMAIDGLPHSETRSERVSLEPVEDASTSPDETAVNETPPSHGRTSHRLEPHEESGLPIGEVADDLLDLLAAAMFVDAGTLSCDRPFTEQGLDSILGVEFINAVNRRFQLKLKTTAIYRWPTVTALAAEIAGRDERSAASSLPTVLASQPTANRSPDQDPPARQADQPSAERNAEADSHSANSKDMPAPIAVIGMACRFPGADDVDGYWRLLTRGEDAVKAGPPARPWSVRRSPGGYLDNVDCFDAAFFSISPAEAAALDPQQRIFLEEAYHAIEDALIRPEQIRGSRCGVFAGVAASGYERLAEHGELDRFALTGSLPSMLPARVAYAMNLRGPVLAIDTACSSSLVAVHEACAALRRDDCDLALAGGITLLLNDDAQELTAQFEMNSPTGRCRPFDDAADGVVWSEGCGVVVLKPLDRAIADGDRIHAVIRGAGVNHDGASNGITAPNADSQAALISRVTTRAGVDPATIGYVEAHGTGTSLGDPIELEGLATVFGSRPTDAGRCVIGSVKSNIGHTALAAGVAGLIKTVLCLRERTLVPTLHVERPNRQFAFDDSAFEISQSTRFWEQSDNAPRRAAVSSFGLSGTNAHVVLEEAGGEPRTIDLNEQADWQGNLVLPLSARTPDALRELAGRYRKLVANSDEARLADIAFSATTCRAHQRERVVIEFASKDEVLLQLSAVEAGNLQSTGMLSEAGQRFLQNETAVVAELEAEVRRVAGRPLRRVALPNYPFQRERHWFSGTSVLAEPQRHAARSSIPIAQRRISLESWPWVMDHRVFDRTIAPGALLVALAADAATGQSALTARRVRDSVWGPSSARQDGEVAAAFRHSVVLSNVALRTPLEVTAGHTRELRPDFDAMDAARLSIQSRLEQSRFDGLSGCSDDWVEHCRCRLGEPLSAKHDSSGSAARNGAGSLEPADIRILQTRLAERSAADCYATIESVGIHLGPAMRGLRRVWSAGTEALGEIQLPAIVESSPHADGFRVAHPVLLDSCLQLASVMVLDANLTDAFVPVSIDRVEFLAPLPNRFFCRLTMDRPFESDTQTLRADLELLTIDGVRLGQLSGFVARRVSRDAFVRTDSSPVFESAATPNVGDLLYLIDWVETPRRVPLALTQVVEQSADDSKTDRKTKGEWLTRLSCDFIERAFRESGIVLEPDTVLTEAAIAKQLGVLPRFERLLTRLLAVLVENDILRRTGDGYHRTVTSNAGSEVDCGKDQQSPEAELLTRCGAQLADVLAGRVDPLGLLFPSEGVSAADVYRASSALRQINASVGGIVRSLVQSGRPPAETNGAETSRVINVLEVGAGTGATTAAVLDALSGMAAMSHVSLRYAFSDVGPAFLEHAERNLAEVAPSWVQFDVIPLDLDRPFDQQAFQDGEFDVVIAANVLHATRDLPAALQRLHEVLTPGGMLIIAEAIGRHAHADLTFGLLDGWWHFEDSIRADYPLLAPGQWLDVLRQARFEPSPLTAESDRCLVVDGEQAVIAARSLPAASSSHWLIVAHRRDVAETLAALLADSAAAVEVVAAEQFRTEAPEQAIGEEFTGIVYLADFQTAADGEPGEAVEGQLEERLQTQGTCLLGLVRRLARQRPTLSDGVWLVTEQAVATGSVERVSLDQSPLWGLMAGLATERPELRTFRVDLDDFGSQAGSLATELNRPSSEDTIAWRQEARLVPGLRSGNDPAEGGGISIRSGVTYLITGGTGGLGLETASWLADRGATSIVLVGRRPPNAAAQQAIESLSRGTVQVRFLAADVSCEGDVQRVLEEIRDSEQPLAGVLHAAGTLDDAAIDVLGWSQCETVFAPKIQGAWHLHRLTRDEPLELFVLYSSTAAVLGSHGQANHAAANQFLDQLAHHRRALGLPGISINWGPWSRVGEAARRADDVGPRMRELGFRWLSPQAGMACLERVLDANAVQAVAVDIDWRRFVTATATRSLLRNLSGGATVEVSAAASDETNRDEVAAFIAAEAAALLRMRTAPAGSDSFFDLGMDSLMAVELRNRLNLKYAPDPPLTSTAVFDHPTPQKLAGLVTNRMCESQHDALSARAVSACSVEPADGQSDAIAIVGMSCRFPEAGSLDEFAALLFGGRDAISRVPPSRWDAEAVIAATGAEATASGGWVVGAELFDAEFFGISPREALRMDPQQRITLECVWEAIEHAGVAAGELAGSQTAVFLGVSEADYGRRVMASPGDVDFYAGTGTSASFVAGRVSHTLGLSGPSHVVDTVCSSSLVALHQACQSLRFREADMAIAGGVHLMLSPDGSVALQKTGALSPDGRCRTFDAAANGFGRAEGCGIVILKRLADAERDGDDVLAVVRGSAVNHDGASGGLTIPSGPAQQRVIQAALQRAGVAPRDVDYLEAHGTATSLGDPIELHAAAEVLGTDRDEPLLVGSVKASIGHAEAAAGIAGVIKVVLAMQARRLPPQLHFMTPNPHIDWARLPVRVVDRVRPWPREQMTAGVSSFGLSGTNAHVVLAGPLREAGPRRQKGSSPHASVLMLSARNEAALRQMVARFASWLARHPDVSLADVCGTAARRSLYSCRLAVVADSVEPLQQELARLAETARGGELVVAGKTPIEETLRQAATEFVSGRSTELSTLLGNMPHRRVHLPTYPFQRTRYWIDPPGTSPSSVCSEQVAADGDPEVESAYCRTLERDAASLFDRGSLVELICDQVQAALELSSRPSTTALLTDLGVDSMVAVELQERLRQRVDSDMELPATVALEFPTIERLADALHATLRKQSSDGRNTRSTSCDRSDAAAEDAHDDLDGLSDEEIAARLDDEINAVLGEQS